MSTTEREAKMLLERKAKDFFIRTQCELDEITEQELIRLFARFAESEYSQGYKDALTAAVALVEVRTKFADDCSVGKNWKVFPNTDAQIAKACKELADQLRSLPIPEAK